MWRTITVDDSDVELMEIGRGDPLLFLHGWGLSPRSYDQALTRLCGAGIRVIAPCLPGFGGSQGPALRRITLPEYARRVARLLDVLALEKPAFVAGHSFGGGVALQLATDRPDLIRSVTLINSVGGAPGKQGMSDKSWLRWALGALTELDLETVRTLAPHTLRDFLPAALRRPVTLTLSAVLALRASLAEEATALVDGGTPTLFIWSDQDRLIAPGALARVVSSMPAQMVPGGHGWLLSRPEEFAELLSNALVVHAMLERTRRGQSLVLPSEANLADLFPPERRRRNRDVDHTGMRRSGAS